MGGRGASSGGGNFAQALKSAKAGNLGTTAEDVRDISTTTYGIDTSRLSPAERSSLQRMVDGSGKNNAGVAQAVKNGGVAQINFSDFSSKDLESFINMARKVGSTASQFALNDAIKLLSWNNQNK